MSVEYASLRPYPATPGASPPALPLPPNHQLQYNFQYGVIPPPPREDGVTPAGDYYIGQSPHRGDFDHH